MGGDKKDNRVIEERMMARLPVGPQPDGDVIAPGAFGAEFVSIPGNAFGPDGAQFPLETNVRIVRSHVEGNVLMIDECEITDCSLISPQD